MEDSCPATPLVLVERDSKSPLQVSISSPESDGMKSPDSRCVICLGKLQNKSFTDSCLHQFCFQCLLQWSKVKPECPLCKQPFKSIIHNVRSNMDYDQYHIEPRYMLTDLMHSYNFDLIPVDRRFRYRSTMTREYFRELAESFLARTRRMPEDSYRIHPMVPVDPMPPNTRRHSNRLCGSANHRSRQRGTSDFRRNVYLQDLWVQDLADISGRYRECTPEFYRENPAQLHRIIPWLNREVNVLLSNCDSQAYVLSQILASLTQNPIRSREFRQLIQPYFGNRTDHFIHEFYTFARSVYDIAGFDQNAVYVTNPNYATEVQEIVSSSDDSDVEVLETILENLTKPDKPHKRGFKKTLLKRAHDDKLEEPIAGPSGIGSASLSDPIEICESEDEVKILDYVKPEPEVVTLSSGDESSAQSSLDLQSNKNIKHKKSQVSSDDQDSFEETRSKGGKGKCKSSGFGLKGKQKSKYVKSKRNRSGSESTEYKSDVKSSRSESKSESDRETRNKNEDRNGSRSEKKKESKMEKKRSGSDKSSCLSKVKNHLHEITPFRKSSNTTTTAKSDFPHSYCRRTRSCSSHSSSSTSSSSSSSFRRSRSRSPSCSSNSRSSESGLSFVSSKSSEHKLFKKSKKQKSSTSVKKYKKKCKRKSSQSKKKNSEVDVEEKKKVRSCVIVPDSSCSSFAQNKPSTPTYWTMVPNPAATKYYRKRDSGKTKMWDNSREKRSNKRVRDSSSDSSSDSSEKYSKNRNKDFRCKNLGNRASLESTSSGSWSFSKKSSKKRSDDSGSGDSSSKNFGTGASHESTSSSVSSFSSSNTRTTGTSKNTFSSSATDGSH